MPSKPSKEAAWILEVTQRGDSLRSGAGRIKEQLGEDVSARIIGGVLSTQLNTIFTGEGRPLKIWRRTR